MDHLRTTLKVHVMAIEYPGYGIYPGSTTAEVILEDGYRVISYLRETMGVGVKDMILFGRSLGTGPATELAV